MKLKANQLFVIGFLTMMVLTLATAFYTGNQVTTMIVMFAGLVQSIMPLVVEKYILPHFN